MQSVSDRIIAIVPARAGSARLPGKNIKLVGGITLVERSVLHARAAGADLIAVSTNDESVRSALSRERGLVMIDRPPELASPSASTDEVVHHAIDTLAIEPTAKMLILQPTSPFRDRSLLSACTASVEDNPDALTLSVVRAAKVASWALCLEHDGTLADVPTSCDPVSPSGAVYAFGCGAFKTHGALGLMRKVGVLSHPIHSCDIDEDYEFVMAAALAEAGLGDDVIDVDPNTTSRR